MSHAIGASTAAIRRREPHERIVHIDGEQGIEAVTTASLVEIRKLLKRK
nr:hypothetical protein [Myxococcus vastator]